MRNLLKKLEKDFPDIKFEAGDAFYWSPDKKTVFYLPEGDRETSIWSLLHEVSHGLLEHSNYGSDFELLKLESEAWAHANKLSGDYDIKIDQEHIQDCLDTYRDWLYGRSTCPKCGVVASQDNSTTYKCFNCKNKWRVSSSRFCRPYRMSQNMGVY